MIWICWVLCLLSCRQEDAAPSAEQLAEWTQESWTARAEGNYKLAATLAEKVVALRDSTSQRIHLGSSYFMAGDMAKAIAAYDGALKLEPEVAPQLWQRGLALYYAGRYKDGQKQFETHQTYNTQDVENAVWHMLCRARVDGLERARRDLIPIQRDTRIPMKQIHQLFAGTASMADVMEAAESVGDPNRRKESLYYAHLYIGLFQEMTDDSAGAQKSMQAAMKVNPIPAQYLMGQVAKVHWQLRKAKALEKTPSRAEEPEVGKQ